MGAYPACTVGANSTCCTYLQLAGQYCGPAIAVSGDFVCLQVNNHVPAVSPTHASPSAGKGQGAISTLFWSACPDLSPSGICVVLYCSICQPMLVGCAGTGVSGSQPTLHADSSVDTAATATPPLPSALQQPTAADSIPTAGDSMLPVQPDSSSTALSAAGVQLPSSGGNKWGPAQNPFPAAGQATATSPPTNTSSSANTTHNSHVLSSESQPETKQPRSALDTAEQDVSLEHTSSLAATTHPDMPNAGTGSEVTASDSPSQPVHPHYIAAPPANDSGAVSRPAAGSQKPRREWGRVVHPFAAAGTAATPPAAVPTGVPTAAIPTAIPPAAIPTAAVPAAAIPTAAAGTAAVPTAAAEAANYFSQ